MVIQLCAETHVLSVIKKKHTLAHIPFFKTSKALHTCCHSTTNIHTMYLMTPKKCKYICFHVRWWRFHTFPSYTSIHRLVVLHFIFRDNFSLLDILRFICEVDKILTCFCWTQPPSAPKPNLRCVVSFWTLFILEYNICLLTK